MCDLFDEFDGIDDLLDGLDDEDDVFDWGDELEEIHHEPTDEVESGMSYEEVFFIGLIAGQAMDEVRYRRKSRRKRR